MRSLVAFGEALIDLLQDPRDPGRYHRNAGGAPANVAVGFARLGGQAAFMGMLGEDSFGDFLHQQLADNRVDTRWVQRTGAANTALAVVSLAADGERSFNFYRPPSADLLMHPSHVPREAFADSPYLHLCSNSLTHDPARSATLEAWRHAEQHGCLISFDINWRPRLWPADSEARLVVRALLPRAHVIKFSAEEWHWLAGANEAALLAECFAGITALIVVTDSGAPVRTFTRGALPALHTPTVVDVIDTTAAGDAFVAALLRQFAVHGLDPSQLRERLVDASWLSEQITVANRCAALACTRFGAFDSLPTMDDYLGRYR